MNHVLHYRFIVVQSINIYPIQGAILERFCCFDAEHVRAAYSPDDHVTLPQAQQRQQAINRHVREIAKELGVDGTRAVLEYRTVAPLVLELTSPGRPLATASNSTIWKALLDEAVLPQLSTMTALQVLIRFYISIEDGECVVERDLGTLTSITHAHKNGGGDLSDDAMMA